MKKNTQEEIENGYKEAIRSKYRTEKVEGIHSHYLNNPSQALLRDLCWEIFNSNPKPDDLAVYRNFFKFDFNSKEENISTPYTDKFKKVGAFLRGDKEPAKITTIELAAILVNYQFRPFKKFSKEGWIEIDNSVEETLKPVNNPHVPEVIFIKNDNNEEFQKSNEIKEDESIQEGDLNDKDLCKEENLNKTAFSNEENILTVDEILIEAPEEDILKEIKTTKQAIKPLELFLGFKKELPQKESIIKRNKWIRIGVVSFLVVLGWYYFPEKKECMQWTNDHYEIVDCDLKKEGFIPTNAIEVLDPGLVNLKKITICDTTTCFDKNGVAIIWYAKTTNGVDFFNSHGMHPENNKPLKPVTRYILEKYVK